MMVRQRLLAFLAVAFFVLFFISPPGSAATDVIDTKDGSILQVSIPSSLDFSIDPFEVANRGQIYSDTYTFTNYGNVDVLLSITNIEVIYSEDDSFVPMLQSFDGNDEQPLKAVYLQVNIENAGVKHAITATDNNNSGLSVLLNAQGNEEGSSTCSLSITGNVNKNPAEMWQDGDVKLSVMYVLEVVDDIEDSGTDDNISDVYNSVDDIDDTLENTSGDAGEEFDDDADKEDSSNIGSDFEENDIPPDTDVQNVTQEE